MAYPANILDPFKSYVYHFELHAASTWDALKSLETQDLNAVTTPYAPNGTLLINTRRDAHQTIDDVKYHYTGPFINTENIMSPAGNVSMTVFEPNGVSFVEKLEELKRQYNVSNFAGSIQFVLKIFFVGRYADNSIETLPAIVIPMKLDKIEAEFNHMGGRYSILFQISAGGLLPTPDNRLANLLAYTNKDVYIKAKTLPEALTFLQNKLNDNKDFVYEEERTVGRKIRYQITYDPEIVGDLKLVTTKSFKPGDVAQIPLDRHLTIMEWIKQLVMSSKDVTDMIYASAAGLQQPKHPDVKIPTYTARVELTDSEVILAYHVHVYTGQSIPGAGEIFFDYLFSDPGKNVDVMDFAIKYNNILGYLSSTKSGAVPVETGQDPKSPKANPGVTSRGPIVPDRAQNPDKNPQSSTQSVAREISQNDIDAMPTDVRDAKRGYPNSTHDAVLSKGLAFDTLMMAVSGSANQSFRIRGYYQLLAPCIPTPDGQNLGFGTKGGIWIKVNIRDQFKRPFFYTSWYQLLSVEHHFSNGLFTQNLITTISPEAQKKFAQGIS